MKILMIGTIDNRGGAAGIAWELRRRLKRDGHEVKTLVRYKYSDEEDVRALPRKRWQDRAVKLFGCDLWFGASVLKTPEYEWCDLVHCHNLHSNFFKLKDLAKMKKPVIWTMHDMWPFTGFEYNSATKRNPNKKRFLLKLWDMRPIMLVMKELIYRRTEITFVAVSDWLAEQGTRNVLRNEDVRIIHNGVDTDIFYQMDRNKLRKHYNIPLKVKVIACGLKGWQDSQMIIDSYAKDDSLYFIAIGHKNIKTRNPNFRAMEHTADKSEVAKYLAMSDILMHPTPEEAFGMLAAEAMACGCHVVSYGVDGLQEVVGEDGPFAELGNVADLRMVLEEALQIKDKCQPRKRIEHLFSAKKMYKNYLKLYHERLNS